MIHELEYKKRRQKILKRVSKNSITLLFSATPKIRSNDTEYPFRQNSNFYYLTGFREDNACLLLIKNRKKTKSILFVHKKEPQQELWNGKRLGKKEAKKRFLVDEIYDRDMLETILKSESKDKNTLYYDFKADKQKLENIKTYKDISYHIGLQRLIKSKSEIALIQKAIDITALAHHNAMNIDKTDMNEYQLQAEFEYIFKKNGAYNDAYTSIVAGGNSANTLHYIENNKTLKNNELILIDAGCEYNYYASDITRTIATNGRFTPAQKELYNMVLEVQLKIIEMIKPNILRTTLQKKAVELLTDGMIDLKILKGNRDKIIKKELYKKYYPHGIGHWMGIDVHDESPYKYKNGKEIALAKGMVLTIEPGIYIDKEDKDVPQKYRGIGIRIEDDILVTENGFKNLSLSIMKKI